MDAFDLCPEHGGASVTDAGDRQTRSSSALVASLRESMRALALTPAPDDARICMLEAEKLMVIWNQINHALAKRMERVQQARQAGQHPAGQ